MLRAWALLYSGRGRQAILTMKQAAASGFPPATVDYVTFIWNGWGTRDTYPGVALKMLHHADRVHHKAALVWRCKMYRSGKFGLLRKCLGGLILPMARLRYLWATLGDPFSPDVFVFQTWATGPFFRSSAQPPGG